MGYETALEKAGCKIIDFKEFGSYQGTWLAFVEHEGQKGIVEGSYGSCSGCDSFQAEFSYNEPPVEENGRYYKNGYTWDEDDECSEGEYKELMSAYDKKLAEFGKGYLAGGLYDKAHYENQLEKLKTDDWFDGETKEYCEWAIQRAWE